MRRRNSRSLQPTIFAPYGNWKVLPPDSDEPMFRCHDDRTMWYLERGLAVFVSEDPPVIRLTFQPKGPGHSGDPYFLQEFQNRCVVCGVTEGLSHHHIVPHGYRRYFERDSQQLGRWMYDVLLLCIPCHTRYEDMAHEFKLQISKEYGIPQAGHTNLTTEKLRAMKAAAALYRHGPEIPEPKRTAFLETVRAYLGKQDPTREDFGAVWKTIQRSIETTPAGELIAERIANIDDFAVRWRRHFISKMKPRFLPVGWDPGRRVYSEPDQVAKREA